MNGGMNLSAAIGVLERAKLRHRWRGVIIVVLGICASSGCSYFRLGHRSYDEIEEMNKEKQQEQKQFTPGTVFYTQ